MILQKEIFEYRADTNKTQEFYRLWYEAVGKILLPNFNLYANTLSIRVSINIRNFIKLSLEGN